MKLPKKKRRNTATHPLFHASPVKLYCVEVAPNPTKVRLYIAEKNAGGAAIPVTEVRVKLMKGEQNEAAHLARNPFGAIPVLELAPDDFITESLTIMEYLEDTYPAPTLSGSTVRERARIRELERIADLRVLTPIARYIHATKSPIGLPASVDVAAQSQRVYLGGLQYFENTLADGRRFIAGEDVSLADCTLAGGLQFARFAGLDVLADLTRMQAWDRNYRARSPVTEVLSH